MNKITALLQSTAHRPYNLPIGKWRYYQEWTHSLFIHWEIPVDLLQTLVPKKLTIDTIDGKAWISLVAFTMENIRPRYFPAWSWLSNFHEINIRTYVKHEGKSGVFFLNIEAQKILSVYIARLLSGLPYEKANIVRDQKNYNSSNSFKNFSFHSSFEIQDSIATKTVLDRWLTERYCLFLEEQNKLYRYDIHHEEWLLHTVKLNQLQVNYALGDIFLNDRKPDLMHYSIGVAVVAWSKKQLL